jgi:DNA topoisomerase VI subunit B
MKILALAREKNKGDYAPFLVDETLKVWDLYLKEFIREIYFTEERNAVLLLECKDKAEAQHLLNQLPLVKQNLIIFEVYELHPYTGYSILFDKT